MKTAVNRRFALALASSLVLGAGVAAAAGPDEGLLINIPTASGAMIDTVRIDRDVHRPGSPGDHLLALWMQHQLQSYGFRVHQEAFRARTTAPKRLVLALLTSAKKPEGFTLREGPIANDPLGYRDDAGLPFLDGSGDGNVTASMVYANHGLTADYASLQTRGVRISGRIVLIRDGLEPRGQLGRRAQKYGAAGILFYSDPADRGTGRGQTYPDGPWQPRDVVRRGSLGYPDLRIPALPISAANAQQLLNDMRGLAAPANWIGGLEAPYTIGLTQHKVHLQVVLARYFTTMWNTVATLRGTHPDSRVILGAHRDAWVTGATANGSGISIIMEVARALGYLHATGWQPRRSITIIGFDGETVGTVGSSWYVYDHQRELEHGAVAYLNADTATTGTTLTGNAVAALLPSAFSALQKIPDPAKSTSMLSERPGANLFAPPAGGSDFEPFLYNLGIPTMQFAFSGPFGVDNSSYDDLNYAERIADPSFANHRALAQLYALLAVRLAQASRVPYSFSSYVGALRLGLMRATRGHGSLISATSPVNAAISRFAQAAARYDRRPLSDQQSLDAVHILNRLLYGRQGYASVAFPALAKALETGNGATVGSVAMQTARQLDAVSTLLR